MAGEDYVHVRLSAAGEKLAAKGGVLRITAGHCSFLFKVGVSQRVTAAYDWAKVLQHEFAEGQPLFEITATATANEPAAPAQQIE